MYEASQVEKKWQKRWADKGIYTAALHDEKRPKYYNLVMFPYPSGDKLHVGHWYNYAPADSWGRYMRMKGYNVFEPIGFDSFGLPAENYAIKTGVPPVKSIGTNCAKMEQQLSLMGTMYDWSKKVVTSDPEYYQWTQWVFLQLYKKGLAYRKRAPVNWCPVDNTVLANEQVVDGKCERCKNEVTKRDLTQWFFNIRSYAEQLLDFSELQWPEKTMLMQKHWIGKSSGCDVTWKVKGQDIALDTFTTTVDTIYGVTFVVISPEHPLLEKLVTKEHRAEVTQYQEAAKKITDIDRVSDAREKTGVFTGSSVINPFSQKEVPLWVADYVLMSYGTGVVMGVPAHDQRDMDFAKKYDLEIVQSVVLDNGETFVYDDVDKYHVSGKLVDSDVYTGVSILGARKILVEELAKRNLGKQKIEYKLRDWLVSRQRYWGAPIPIIYCKDCGDVAVPEEQLPVVLPEVVDYVPKGKSPLAAVPEFVETTCPKCGKPAERESDTMDTFVDSSWYFLRYPSARMKEAAFDRELVNHWMPVDMYIGGPEHACMHLLYARFIHMVMRDLGYVDTKEPFKRLVHQGLVTKDGAKMSKSKGNVVSPDEFVERYGSDVFRMYLMFMGPFEAGGDWSDQGITGVARFVDRFWTLMSSRKQTKPEEVSDLRGLQRNVHRTVKKVREGIEAFTFNTAIAALMEFVNEAMKTGVDLESRNIMVRLIAPLAPHLAEEIWEFLGGKSTIFDESFPEFDPAMLIETSVEIAIQVNGKVRGTIVVDVGADKEAVLAAARGEEHVAKYLEGATVKKEIYVPGKLVSFVI